MLRLLTPFLVLLLGFFVFVPQVSAGPICNSITDCFFAYSVAYFPYFVGFLVLTLIVFKLLSRTIRGFIAIMISLMIASVGVLFYHNVLSVMIEKSIFTSESVRIAKTITVPLYAPTYLPKGYQLDNAGAEQAKYPAVYFMYKKNNSSDRFIFVESAKSVDFDFNPPHCYIYGITIKPDYGGGYVNFYDGLCEKTQTPDGVNLYIGKHPTLHDEKIAFFVLNKKTLGIIYLYTFSDEELFSFIDGLEIQQVDKLTFKTSSLRIGR